MKSSRSAAKRFKKTGTGKITYHKAGRRHLLNKKSAKRKRSLRKQGIISGPDKKRIGRLIPFK